MRILRRGCTIATDGLRGELPAVPATAPPDSFVRMLDGLPDSILVVDASCTPVAANRSFHRLLAGVDRGPVPPSGYVASTLLSELPEAQALREAVKAAIAGEVTRVERVPIQAANGLLRRTAWVSPLATGGGPPEHVLISLSAEEGRLEALLEHTSDVITVLEPDGTIRYSNPAASRITQYEGTTLAGTSAFGLVHPDDRDRALRAFAERLEQPGRSEPVRLRLLYGDGTWHSMEAHLNNRTGDPGVRGVVVTLHDVTDRERVQEELARSERRMRSLVENLSDVIVVLDADARVSYASPAIERIVGAPAPTHLGLSAFNDVHPDDLPRARAVIGELLARPGERRRFEIRLHHEPDDAWRWVDVVAVSRLDDPAVQGVICTLRDVTELKEAEQALQAAYEQEREAAAQLRQADRLKDEFLATVSHELRTPLTSIIGFTEVLSRTEQVDPQLGKQLLERVAANAEEMRWMVEEILDVSSLEAGRVVLTPSVLDLHAAVSEALESLASRLAGREVTVDVPEHLVVLADPGALTHVLRSLLTNAAKYSESGSAIRVRAHGDGSHVAVSVEDHGVGIPAEEQPRVFERFFQGSTAAVTPGSRGTGLGLSIARRYVELQGGDIRVESEPGRGSTFTFTLHSAAPRAAAR